MRTMGGGMAARGLQLRKSVYSGSEKRFEGWETGGYDSDGHFDPVVVSAVTWP